MDNIYIFEGYTPLLDIIKNENNTDIIIVPNLKKDSKNLEYTVLSNHKFIYLIKIQNDYLGKDFQNKSKEEMIEIYNYFKYGIEKIIYKDRIVLDFGIYDIRYNIQIYGIDTTTYYLDKYYNLVESFKID